MPREQDAEAEREDPGGMRALISMKYSYEEG
jgi:hypothetical protein